MLIALVLGVLCRSESIESRVDDLVRRMTLEEKISLCHGATDFATAAIPRLGIPSYKFSDGPNGVRYPWNVPTTSFATGVSMASTWDPTLIRKVGAAIGEETLAKGNSVILGPGVNIVRTPLGGRSFEYYGEDPWLARETAIGFIEGVQSKGVAACVKHFAANSIENQRGTVSAEMDERTLREIYLPAFEGAVREAHVKTVMCAYNRINGSYCSENPHLINDILKGEWGFQGYLMSDWGAVHSTIPAALAGMDLEMPGNEYNFFGKRLETAVKEGKVPESVIDDKAKRFLRVMLELDATKPKSVPPPACKAHLDVAEKLAEEAPVLLKNDSGVLPLKKKGLRSVVVIGPNADQRMSFGGGSCMVNSPMEVTPLEGIRRYLGGTAKVSYVNGSEPSPEDTTPIPADQLQTEDGQTGLACTISAFGRGQTVTPVKRVDTKIDFAWGDTAPAPGIPDKGYMARWTGYLVPKESGMYYVGTLATDSSRVEVDSKRLVDNSDGWGTHPLQRVMNKVELIAGAKVPITVTFRKGDDPAEIHLLWAKAPEGEQTWIGKAVQAAKSSDAVVLVVGTNHFWDGEAHDKPNLNLYGDQDRLAEAVLEANPKTVVVLVNGTAVEMPWISDAHAILEDWYGGTEAGTALAKILFGEVNPSGKLPLTFPAMLSQSPPTAMGDYPPKAGKLPYSDGILVGYRYFDTKKVEPLFPFGHGLSYTKFGYSALSVSPEKDGFAVKCQVKNEGQTAGSEVVQVYVRPKTSKVLRPFQELKGFSRIELKPGGKATVNIALPSSAFSYYSEHGWTVDPGQYEVAVGSSSRDIRLHQDLEITAPTASSASANPRAAR
ncbi:MAG TPA: glycoside hydrolase family 3 C-terminal domain-containing protein [Fimbriimonas sp.]|nr:glycoside hydrolase family 3 C-terminal domain-containing protein [Fimbriimonas sp.]